MSNFYKRRREWYLADAFAMALDEKAANPEIDFAKAVEEFWADMQRMNAEEGWNKE